MRVISVEASFITPTSASLQRSLCGFLLSFPARTHLSLPALIIHAKNVIPEFQLTDSFPQSHSVQKFQSAYLLK